MGNACFNPNNSSRNLPVQHNRLNRRNVLIHQNHLVENEENSNNVPASNTVLNLSPKSTILNHITGTDLMSRYELGAELGRGTYGVAYLCTDRITGDKLACKSISKEKHTSQASKVNMRREVEIMQRLPSHRNLIALKATYEDDRAVHLVMELCKGGELYQTIAAQGYYSEKSAVIVAKAILKAIQICHQNGVMHRDLKPQNFLFVNETNTATLKLIDFGFSIPFAPGQKFRDGVGSPLYVTPEVYYRNYGRESDVWSAGIIIYILLCGTAPFYDDDEEGLAMAIIKSPLRFETDPWEKVSENAKDLIKGLLNRNTSQRLTAQQALEHPWFKNFKKTRLHEIKVVK